MERYGVTLYFAVPPVLLMLTRVARAEAVRPLGLRYIMVGAAPLPPEIARRIQELTGIPVLQGYGMTEASPLTHINPVDDPS